MLSQEDSARQNKENIDVSADFGDKNLMFDERYKE